MGLLVQIEELRGSIVGLDRQRDELMWERDQLIHQALREKAPGIEIVPVREPNNARVYQVRAAYKSELDQEGTT